MKNNWVPLKKDEQTIQLDECPFCHSGETFFMKSTTHSFLMVVHYPPAGINCPARMEQVCDNQEQGASWWNDRSVKIGDDFW